MITSAKFKSLLNGGGNVKILTVEIAALEAESDTARNELCTIPAKRADLIMLDDPAAAITKLEGRERELELILERNAMQLSPLKQRLGELRLTELAPRIAHHQGVLLKMAPEIEKAVRGLQAANQAAHDALRAAIVEVGVHGAHLLPVVHFGAVPTDIDMCLTIWRGHIEERLARIDRAQKGDSSSRASAVNLDALKVPYAVNGGVIQAQAKAR